MKAQQLADIAAEVARRFPDAELMRNPVGNLCVIDDGVYVGWIDLSGGEGLTIFEPILETQ